MVLRILAIADIHSDVSVIKKFIKKIKKSKKLQTIDVITICGDISLGNDGTIGVIISELESLNKPLLCVTGNWDSLDTEDFLIKKNINLRHSPVEIKNCLFIGFNEYSHYSENYEDEYHLSLKIDSSKYEHIIWLSHEPPRDTCADIAYTGLHVGSSHLRDAILEFQPSLVLCAHIHESFGHCFLNQSLIVNSGALYEGSAAIITLDKVPIIEFINF